MAELGDLEQIYSRDWFENDFRHLQPEFNVVADAIGREFSVSMSDCVLDIGCGPAMLIERLREKFNASVWGIEGSQHGIDLAEARCPALTGFILHADICKLTTPQLSLNPTLIVCTEVAEHLDERDAPHLVALVASFTCPVVWTAAPPGQDGHHHVNCKPFGYWSELFGRHGMRVDAARLARLQERWRGLSRLSHMRPNLAVWV